MLKKKKIEITYYSTINSKRDYTNLIIEREQILDVRGEAIEHNYFNWYRVASKIGSYGFKTSDRW